MTLKRFHCRTNHFLFTDSLRSTLKTETKSRCRSHRCAQSYKHICQNLDTIDWFVFLVSQLFEMLFEVRGGYTFIFLFYISNTYVLLKFIFIKNMKQRNWFHHWL